MPSRPFDITQPNPLLTTKLHIPSTRVKLVPRPRLIERLNRGLHGKLTLVSAPVGFGKTTLLSEWVRQSGRPTGYLSLDQGDNDQVRFLAYLIAALQGIEENVGADVQATLGAPQPPAVETWLTMLINDIAALETELTLILDDCHRIDAQPICDALDFLLEYLPENMHLVLSGRLDLPLSLSRLRAGGQLTEIRSSQLRFTKTEAAAFLNDLMGLGLSPQDIAALDARTEGWIAGLQLAALSLQDRRDKEAFVAAFSGSHYHVIDYLADEVMSRQPKAIQTFLYQTSILERFCAPLCDALLETAASEETLARLVDANLFLVPLDDVRGWYRYHHLFSDFLTQRLHEREPERIPELHCRAAKWYEQNELIPEAVNHALAAEDFDGAAHLVEQSARHSLERSELAQLMKWVDALPDEHVRARPWLCVFHAWALRLSGVGFEAVESRLRDAEQALKKHRELPQVELVEELPFPEEEARKILGHIAGIRAYQALYREEIPRVIELAHQALEYRPEGNFVRSSIALALGWAYRFSGDLVAARKALGEARTIGLMSGNIYLAVAATCRAAHGLVLGGKLHQAVESYQEAVQMTARKDGRRLPVAGYAHVYLGGVYREWNDLETATRHLVEGIDLCTQVGYIMDQVVGHVTLARVRWAQGDSDGARDALLNAEQLSQRMKSYVYVRRWVEDCQVRLWLAQGNLDAAAHWAQESGLRADDELTFMRELEHIILARALVALGREQPRDSQINDALSLLTRLLKTAETAGWMGKAIEILVLQALALQVQGDEEEALTALERAVTLAEPEDYVRTFLDEGASMEALLRLAASRGIAPGYVGKLLTAFEPGTAPSQLPPASPLIEPLSKRELEVVRLLATELSGPEIARELTVALSTVRYHTNNIYDKLSVHNRRAAVRRAEELSLL